MLNEQLSVMNLKDELLAAIEALNRAELPYALCGGMAVVLHGYPRLTRDIDILIRPDDLPKAIDALAQSGFDIRGGLIPFDTGGTHERKIFRVSKIIADELLTIDLLLLPRFLEEVWRGREVYEVNGKGINVISRRGLIEMKKIAGRQQDLSDIENLEPENGR